MVGGRRSVQLVFATGPKRIGRDCTLKKDERGIRFGKRQISHGLVRKIGRGHEHQVPARFTM